MSTQFLKYVQNNDLVQIKKLISTVLQNDLDKGLSLASEKGHLEVVKYLFENGADIHAKNDEALIWASMNGHLEVVKFLVKNGADIHSNEDEALIYASTKGHLNIVKYLIGNGANIHVHDDYPLRLASSNGNLDFVKYLVENGADIYYNDEALKLALQNGHLEVVQYLIQNKANENILDKDKDKDKDEDENNKITLKEIFSYSENKLNHILKEYKDKTEYNYLEKINAVIIFLFNDKKLVEKDYEIVKTDQFELVMQLKFQNYEDFIHNFKEF
jgi:ankyrin repeat protein